MADNKTSIILTAEDRTRAAFASAKAGMASLESVAGRVNGLLSTLGVGAIAGGGLIAFAKSGIDAADAMNDMSQKIGVSVENLAGYKLAAEQSGTSLEAMGKSANFLNKNIAENDPLLESLGITAKDANGALIQLADVFAAMPDGAQKTAVALKLMGKSGTDMIPMLNGGGGALRQMLADGQSVYGITTEMARAADQFNDRITRLKVQSEGLAVTLGNALMPALAGVIDHLSRGASLGGEFGFFKLIAHGINPTGDLARELKNVRNEIAATEKQFGNATPGTLAAEDTRKKLDYLNRVKAALEEIQRNEALALGAKYANYKMPSAPLKELDAWATMSQDEIAKINAATAKAFDLKPLDDYIAGFATRAAKISAEYEKLRVSMQMGPVDTANATGSDVSGSVAFGRAALAAGKGEEAQAWLERAKQQLGAARQSGAVGSEGTFYVDQLKSFELALNDTAQKIATATRDAIDKANDAAKKAITAMDPVKIPIAVDAIARDIQEAVRQAMAGLQVDPMRAPVQTTPSPSGPSVMDIRWSASAVGAR